MNVLTEMSVTEKKNPYILAKCMQPGENKTQEQRERERKTHIITNPLNIPNSPAFRSQKLRTNACIPTSTAVPTAGMTTAVNATPSTNGRTG